jgi:uncharacterized membrane protein
MPLRSARERFYQTISFELGGILIAAPLYAIVFGGSAENSFALLIILSAVVMAWSPLHNSVFDWFDERSSGRTASERPHGLRLVHALSQEVSSTLVTLPLVMWIGQFDFWQALGVEISLTLLYAAYAYLFHIAYDRVRPVTSNVSNIAFAYTPYG